ncbi:uncharacterized protein C11orf52 homolog isoform X2 [Ambystoma mexicanum]|uniref:uncharacterized protein C11orf52 homolog isoform X2 n=1 Tax=Ambystoma mexicanum TaxID=8296 RepID=UPI0037E89F54
MEEGARWGAPLENSSSEEMQTEVKTVDNSAHMYDTVSDFPVYAVVNKNRPPVPGQDDGVQYAEIQVFSADKKRVPAVKPVVEASTEYATLNYPKAYPKACDNKNGTLV